MIYAALEEEMGVLIRLLGHFCALRAERAYGDSALMGLLRLLEELA